MADFRGVDRIVYALKAEIRLRNGQTIQIAEEDIASYNPNTTMSTQGIPLGSVSATAYTLTFNNQQYALTDADLDGAEVHVYVSEGEDTGAVWEDYGIWFAESIDLTEQDAFATISGSDALSSKFNAKWADTKKDYPRKLLLIAQTMCAIAGVELATQDFRNADYVVAKMPEWESETTIRDVISYIAVCAAGFARINYSGKLEILTIGKTPVHIADADYYTRFAAGGRFEFNCFQYRFKAKDGDDEPEYTRYAIDSSVEDNATNTIQMDGNPLITGEIANDIASALAGAEYAGAAISWFGGVEVLPGDELILIDTKGAEHRLILNAYSLTMAGGISCEAACDMPSSISETGFYSQGPSVFNPDGTLNAEAIAGLDQKVISAGTAYFNNLTAQTVNASKLLAAIIDAVTLRANNIDAGNIETDILTAMLATIVDATIKKLTAGTIATDDLFAALAEIVGLKVGTLTASDIQTDRLAAALAAFTVISAGTADFDRATAENLVAHLFNLTGEAVMEDVFIHNLRIAYAQMVSASIGNLVLRAVDGAYYRIDVDQTGNVTATAVAPTDQEITEGMAGDRPIIETAMTVEEMNAGSIKAVHMLVNKIDAARIDAQELFASKGFIQQLQTADISNNETISIISGKVDDLPIRTDFTQKAVIISDAEGASSVRIDSKSVNIGTVYGPGQGFSKLAANYVQFGDQQMRRTSDGGIAFKLGGEVIWQQ